MPPGPPAPQSMNAIMPCSSRRDDRRG
jgi:hypothetical protein